MQRSQILLIDQNARKIKTWLRSASQPVRRRWLFHLVRFFVERMYSKWSKLNDEQQMDRLFDIYARVLNRFQSRFQRVTARKVTESLFKTEINWALTKGDIQEAIVYIVAREVYYILNSLHCIDWFYEDGDLMPKPHLILPPTLLPILKQVPSQINLSDEYNEMVDDFSPLDSVTYQARDFVHRIKQKREGTRHHPIVLGGITVFDPQFLDAESWPMTRAWGDHDIGNTSYYDNEMYAVNMTKFKRDQIISNLKRVASESIFPSFKVFAEWVNRLPYPTQINLTNLRKAVPPEYRKRKRRRRMTLSEEAEEMRMAGPDVGVPSEKEQISAIMYDINLPFLKEAVAEIDPRRTFHIVEWRQLFEDVMTCLRFILGRTPLTDNLVEIQPMLESIDKNYVYGVKTIDEELKDLIVEILFVLLI